MTFWHEWRGSIDGRPSMLIRHILSWRDYKVDLHKFIRADDPTCFHTHPAKAIRIILWGGYEEEIFEEVWDMKSVRAWRPGNVGVLRPELCHRINRLLNERSSYSIWIRWPKSAEIKIYGEC